MRLLIVGAGATGGYFGGRLAQAGRDVTFLVRPARAQQLRSAGLQIVSPHGDVTLAPKLVEAQALDASYDLIILSVKAYSLDAALKDIAPAMGPKAVILPLLNGMRHMDAIASAFGAGALLGSLCSIAVTLDEQGRILHFSQFHNFVYGETSGLRSERIERLDAVMQHAVFDARLSLSIKQDMWNKWMMLATLAGVTCLMRGSIGEIAAAPGGRDFVHRFFDEVVAVATAEGYAPGAAFLNETRALLTAEGSPLTSLETFWRGRGFRASTRLRWLRPMRIFRSTRASALAAEQTLYGQALPHQPAAPPPPASLSLKYQSSRLSLALWPKAAFQSGAKT